MTLTVKSMLAAAHAAVERIDIQKAKAVLEQGGLLLDVREAAELAQTGRAVGSHHIPRGLLEFKADTEMPSHDPELRPDRPVVLLCASGGRAALAGKLLQDMGYDQVYNLGGLTDWVNGGGEVEK